MKKTALFVALIGIGILIWIMVAQPVLVEEYSDIREMPINKRVSLSGEVSDERDFDGLRVMKVGGIEVVCSCSEKIIYLGKSVEVIGIVEEYEERKQIRALEISILG